MTACRLPSSCIYTACPASLVQLQEYVRKIGACLVQLEQSKDNKAKTMMETLTNESSRLIGCIKLLNHNVHRAMLMGKMDESLSNSHKLGAAFYSNLSVRSLAVCTLTENAANGC